MIKLPNGSLSGHNTHVMATNGLLSVIYARTLIVTADANDITLDSGGYRTLSTKKKMNQTAKDFELGFQVYQKKNKWFVQFRDNVLPFMDGMILHRHGDKINTMPLTIWVPDSLDEGAAWQPRKVTHKVT